MVTPSVFIQLGSFNYRWRNTSLANHGVSIWHCLALLLWLNMVTPSVFIQLGSFNYKYIIGESWGECLTLFGIVVMAKYGNSFSFHPIRFI
jgi:hypothetical protein